MVVLALIPILLFLDFNICKMQYLVTYTDSEGIQQAFYTHWFDVENHFNHELSMVVFDLVNHCFMSGSLGWVDIHEDHL